VVLKGNFLHEISFTGESDLPDPIRTAENRKGKLKIGTKKDFRFQLLFHYFELRFIYLFLQGLKVLEHGVGITHGEGVLSVIVCESLLDELLLHHSIFHVHAVPPRAQTESQVALELINKLYNQNNITNKKGKKTPHPT
jgi:hypothetical protein